MKRLKPIDSARKSYNVSHWSMGYYGINDDGEMYVSPKIDDPKQQASLSDIAQSVQAQGYSLPLLLRFPQILHHRVESICAAFNQAIERYEYQNKYFLMYPIKVNQQREVIDEILSTQTNVAYKQLGLEAGSKAELLAVLALAHKASSMIITNGYKDREYIRLALLGSKLGHKVYIVLEKLSELKLVLDEAKALNVKPLLGLRIRLASQQSHGHWQSSGGEKSKFGLSASQVLSVVTQLKELGKLDYLQLIHFHLGSQMTNIRDVRTGVSEAARFYCELRQLGAEVNFIDVGGGLAVDYDGTRSQATNSMNYSLAEYANNIVSAVGDTCYHYQQPCPIIISESGRALTAHHAVLISNVIDAESYSPEKLSPPPEDAPILLENMWQSWLQLSTYSDDRALVEIYHDTQNDLVEVQSQFVMGMLSLEQRAWAERVNLRSCYEIYKLLDSKNRFHRPIIDELAEKMASKFFVNFSLFQSLPDTWGIKQVFPILPLSGLAKSAKQRAVLLDITCDSGGAIDQYVDGQGIETTLPVPAWTQKQQYLFGFFLVGAYQEILGDMHNLFGDTHCATVSLNKDGEIDITQIDEGDTVADMLRYVHLDADRIKQTYAELVAAHLPENERAEVLAELEQGLNGYTYFEDY